MCCTASGGWYCQILGALTFSATLCARNTAQQDRLLCKRKHRNSTSSSVWFFFWDATSVWYIWVFLFAGPADETTDWCLGKLGWVEQVQSELWWWSQLSAKALLLPEVKANRLFLPCYWAPALTSRTKITYSRGLSHLSPVRDDPQSCCCCFQQLSSTHPFFGCFGRAQCWLWDLRMYNQMIDMTGVFSQVYCDKPEGEGSNPEQYVSLPRASDCVKISSGLWFPGRYIAPEEMEGLSWLKQH